MKLPGKCVIEPGSSCYAKNGTRITRMQQMNADLIRADLSNPFYPRAILPVSKPGTCIYSHRF